MPNQLVTVELNNSYSQIRGLDSSRFLELKKILSYEMNPEAAFFSKNRFNTTRYLIDNKGFFPTGLSERVFKYLNANSVNFTHIERRVKPKPLDIEYPASKFKLYEDQEIAVALAVNANRGTISMPTGTGKSCVIANIIRELKVKFLVVVPSLEIKKQLTESLLKDLGTLKYVLIENIDSKQLKKANDCAGLIIDEAHHVAAKTYRKLNKQYWGGLFYRFFLTATPYRNKSEEQILFESLAGKLIFSLSYKEAIQKKYIVPIEAFCINVEPIKNDYYTWHEVYDKLVVNNHLRNHQIAQVLFDLLSAGRSTLCLVKEIEHGTTLSSITGIPFVNGQDDSSRELIQKFNAGEISALIGTTGVIGEGIDTRPAEYIIITGLGKAKSAFLQQIGRGVRNYPGKESCKVVLFRDVSHKFCLRHYREQCKILRDEFSIKVDIL